MIHKTNFCIPKDVLELAITSLPNIDHRLTLNARTNNFFYDEWKIKDEYKDTVWEKILDSLPYKKGEARLIKLDSGTTYMCHADIDNRWHMSLTGNQSYLIDFDSSTMHKLDIDGYWYDMDARKLHVASNFGEVPRVQLVVRQLLNRGKLENPIHVTISPAKSLHDYRYKFDNIISPWLNKVNSNNKLNNFTVDGDKVKFSIDESVVSELSKFNSEIFTITL